MPIDIDVEQYKRRAKELLKRARLGNAEALARLREHHPKHASLSRTFASIKLADAQIVIARENDFSSWPRLVEYLHFRNAVAALDAGDLERLEAIVDTHPAVLRYECRIGEWYEDGYFAGATLLMHIAGNPVRAPLPENIVAVAKVLIERHFTREIAHRTVGLLLTSRQASEAGVALTLLDLLTTAGARFDLHAPEVLEAPLLNHAPGTAQALVSRGAGMHLRHAAALGDLDAMRPELEKGIDQGRLNDALMFATIRGQRDSVALLVAHGAKGDVLLAPGGATSRSALHEAANRGYDEIVDLLIAAGASAEVKDERWGGTAAGWADAGGFPDLGKRLRDLTP